jgi:L-arabinose isomerase
MINLQEKQIWFFTGSQHLYGEEVLRTVAENSRKIVEGLRATKHVPLDLTLQPVLTAPEAISELCAAASAAPNCAGVILWMHTFSPAKMWLAGLRTLSKPVLHLHTQFNRDLPWSSIDMDFMNLNQSAHGDREFGHLAARLGLRRKVVAGHWQDPEVTAQIATWSRAAAGWHESQRLKIARFGDNMREVAVTEGDKVEAQAAFGYSVNGYGVGDLVCRIQQVSDAETASLLAEYDERYSVAEPLRTGGAAGTAGRGQN